LNAGNVLGAEDSRPIPKWEAIIRKTLNKSLTPESKHKSFSAPPSPVLRTSSVADVLAAEVDAHPLDMMSEECVSTALCYDMEQEALDKVMGIGMNLQLKRIYGIDCDHRLDWPEHSLDATPQVISSNSKLRRVFSSSGRIGFNLTDNSLLLSPKRFALNDGRLKRSHHSSGNLGLMWMEQQQEKPEVLDSLSDAYSTFSDEEDDNFCELPQEQHNYEVMKNSWKSCPSYVRIVSKQMVGIYVSVWVRKSLRRHINNLKVSLVGVGLMGYMGNKVINLCSECVPFPQHEHTHTKRSVGKLRGSEFPFPEATSRNLKTMLIC
jgi:hypothetical protein